MNGEVKMPYLLGSRRQSWWQDIWDTVSAEWKRSSSWEKFTLFFRVIWALLSIGFKQRHLGIAMVGVLIFIMAIAVIVGVGGLVWIFFAGGYKLVLNLLQPIAMIWISAVLAWAYLRHEYPGRYAMVRGRNVEASTVRQSPFWIALVFTFLWIGILKALDLGNFLSQKFRGLTGLALWKVACAVVIGAILLWTLYLIVKKLRSGREANDKSVDVFTALAIGALVTAVLNVLLFLSLPLWQNMWESEQQYFWATNLAMALAVAMFFVKDKEGKAQGWARKLAYVFLFFVALSLLSPVVQSWHFGDKNPVQTRTAEAPAGDWGKEIDIPYRHRFSFEGTGAFWVKSNYGRVVRCDPVNKACEGGLEASSITLMAIGDQPVSVTVFLKPM